MTKSLRQPVFLVSVAVVFLLVVLGASFPAEFGQAAGDALRWVTTRLGWFYLLSVFGFVVVLIYLAFSKYGEIRLGPPDSEPEFSYFSWIAMLLATGFGVGLVFYGVAEPMKHYLNPPYAMLPGGTEEAARLAIQYSFFNWGVHQWAAFAIVGLIIGYYQFRKHKPGLVSTVLEPITRKLPAGDQAGGALDVFAVVATVMGVATSLGLGVLQINGGLAFLFGLPEGFAWQAIILGAMAAAYIVSTATGLARGIKILSTINLALALALMAYVLAFGPTLTILETVVQGLGDYLQNFFVMSLRTGPYDETKWAADWTVFYWAWVIAWSPFVGTFVARISHGRTIKEYVFGVLVMPPLLACLWIGVFGGAALYLELAREAGLAAAVDANITTALFKLLALLPLADLLSIVGMVLIFIFLITSADSASYIVAQMTDRGSTDPPLAKRIAWGLLIAGICLTLIATGGLQGLQAGAVLSALPFTFILYAMVWELLRVLAADRRAALEELYEKHEAPVAATIEEARQLAE
ncbi:MAG: glycine/betaine ABC transporter permease [Betaproteobacteria bacterium]|nr:MAG: glycine/betaine ABC transporter permease [Betaproteobacteria bacterium]